MQLSFSEEKTQKILVRCQKTLDHKLVSVEEVPQFIGTLSSAAPLQYQYLQKQQIGELRTSPFHKKQTALSPKSRAKIQWWVHNLKLNNRISLV